MAASAYAGRWIARLRSRVIAQGGTPEQARQAALSRYKEEPEISFMPNQPPFNFPPLFERVRALLKDQEIYLVGGSVRDLLLGRATLHDLDFTLAKDGIKTARRVANALKVDFFPLDETRDTGRVIVHAEDGKAMIMDFATFRGDGLEGDLRGRDFTLNAMALDIQTYSIYDPLGGAKDLKDKLLRQCSPTAFADDPVRILRAVRLAAEFDLHIQPETRKAMKVHAAELGRVSPERMRDELFRILEGPKPAACVRALDLLRALEACLPELAGLRGVNQPTPHILDAWEHTLSVVSELENILALLGPQHDEERAADQVNGLLVHRLGRYRGQISAHLQTALPSGRTPRGLLFLAALYHDVAKPQASQVDEDGRLRFWGHDKQGADVVSLRARALALSNEEISHLEIMVRNHMRILFHTNRLTREGKNPSRRAIYRFFRDTGSSGVDLCLLALADLRATFGVTLVQTDWAAALDVVRALLENWFEKPQESITPPAVVDGDDLMHALKLTPGPKVGELLEAIREAQATGEVTDAEQALAFARKKMEENEVNPGGARK